MDSYMQELAIYSIVCHLCNHVVHRWYQLQFYILYSNKRSIIVLCIS